MEMDALGAFASEDRQTVEYARRLKTVRARYEVSRWSVLLSVFAAGVVVGAFIASSESRVPGGTLSASVSTPGVSAPAESEPPAASPTTGAAEAVGTALVSPAPPSPTDPGPPPAPRRAPGHRGTLIVSSQPGGASVFVNGRLAGRTPLVMDALPVGSRAVRVSLDGYAPWSRGVSVVANRSTTVSANLDRSN
jgi:hypothetical protein